MEGPIKYTPPHFREGDVLPERRTQTAPDRLYGVNERPVAVSTRGPGLTMVADEIADRMKEIEMSLSVLEDRLYPVLTAPAQVALDPVARVRPSEACAPTVEVPQNFRDVLERIESRAASINAAIGRLTDRIDL